MRKLIQVDLIYLFLIMELVGFENEVTKHKKYGVS